MVDGAPLERISLELSRHCNLRCCYCYARASLRDPGGLSDEELSLVVEQAVELGACLISIVAGGEPLLRPSMTMLGRSLVDVANQRGCYCYLYTNCTLIDRRGAGFFAARDVSIVGKLNSLVDTVQDELVGVPGSSLRIRRGIDALLDAGLAEQSPSRLALETIICPRNYEEIPALWHFMRTRNIVPEVEIPTLHGRARDHRSQVSFEPDEAPEKYRALFRELARIDRDYYGYDWQPHPPFPAAACRLFETNLYINAQGNVQPCAGVDLPLATLDLGRGVGIPLRDIVKLPGVTAMRDVRNRVEGACRECDLKRECYGCRGAAFHATGNLFAADPVCWRTNNAGCHLADGPCVSSEE